LVVQIRRLLRTPETSFIDGTVRENVLPRLSVCDMLVARGRLNADARGADVEMNRGGVLLLVSYIAPLVSAYGIFMVLSRVLSTDEFADFGVVNAGVTMMNAVLAGGTIQAVSRRIAASSGTHIFRHRRKAVGRQALISLAIVVVLGLLSPVFAHLLGDPSLTRYLIVASAIPAAYALLAVQQGALNGAGQLGGQGALNLIISTLRVLLVVAAVLLGGGVTGALFAILAASLLTFVASWLIPLEGGTPPSASAAPRGGTGRVRVQNDMVVFVIAQVLLQVLLVSDLFLLKAHDSVSTSALIALYVAGQTVARIPYGLLMGVPQLAFSRSARERASSSSLAQSAGLTFALVVGLLLVMLAVAIPLREPLLLVIYPESFRDAAAFLPILLAGAGALAVGDVCQSMVSGARGPRSSVVVFGVAVVFEIVAAFVLIPLHGVMGAAWAALIGASTLALAATVVFFVRIRPTVPWAIVGTGGVLGAGSAMASSLFATFDPQPFAAFVGSGLLALVVGGLFALSVRADLVGTRPHKNG
jgi:O-antigen/teichoic acid export membrane protein